MKYCLNCGQELPDQANFCFKCGSNTNINENENGNRKTVFEGVLHKCPQCGELLDSFITHCPTCGFEIRGSKGLSSVKELSQKLENINNSKTRMELIRNFYIPNTKEDIYEFFILAIANIKTDDFYVDAWLSKLDQAYQKARLLFGDSPEFIYLTKLYKKASKYRIMNSISNSIRGSKSFSGIFIILLGILMIVIGLIVGLDSDFSLITIFGLPIVGFGFIITLETIS